VGPSPAVTSPRRDRIRAVDGLRATAFLLVFLFHTWEFAGKPHIPVLAGIIGANTRVDLFIVLTGFCLYLPFARDEDRVKEFATKQYLRRRMRRIVLPYYAALALAILLPYALKVLYSALGLNGNAHEWPSWGNVVSHLTFTHLFFEDYWSSINGSLWTMSLEMQFYLLFPVILLATARFGRRALFYAVVLSLVYRVGVQFLVADTGWPTHFLWGATGVGRLMEFVAGIAAAIVAVRWQHEARAVRSLGLAATFASAYAIGVLAPEVWGGLPVRDMSLGVGFAALIALAITSRLTGSLFALRPLSRLGFMAYSMFLVHQPLSYYVSEGLNRGLGIREGITHLLLLWIVAFGVVFVVGYAFHVFVERPCIQWSRLARPMTSPVSDTAR
jgi:peptidoglycan/LPS O-acetylase OafA/YrhL